MGIRSFILGVMLLALVGWCMVQESIMQTKARYKLAELAKREAEMHKRLEKLRAVEENLRSPARIAELARGLKLERVALRAGEPESVGKPVPGMVVARLPGDIRDDVYNTADRQTPDVNMAMR